MITKFKIFENENLIKKIQSVLTPDLLKGMWVKEFDNPMAGHCYAATEALYWILGGPNGGWKPYVLSHKTWSEGLDEGETHWFLKNDKGEILDPTKEQFEGEEIAYDKGTPNGMMNYPIGGSKRAKEIIRRITQKDMVTEKNIPIKIDLPDDIYQIKKEFDKYGKKLYVVGGAVRDFYQKIEPHDIDLVTDAQPEESLKILRGKFNVSDEQGKAFGVLRIFTKSEPAGYELATFRKDISKGRDTKGEDAKVEIGKHITIEDDVKRRDLTQNALFYDIDKEEIVDLVGGVEDIDKNVISAVGEASERFIEDRLRILRVFRFTSRNLSKIGQSTIDAIRKDKRLRNVSPIDDVSQERIVEEFIKAVDWSAKNKKFNSLHYYLELLKKYDMFDEMFPELDININGINTFNLSIIFALLFRDNEIEILRIKLRKYKFPNNIADTACFLLRLRDNIENLDKIPLLYKEKNRYHVNNQTILEFGELYNFDEKYLNAFLKFAPRIDATKIMTLGFKGPEISAEVKKREIEEFKKLL